MNDYMNAEKKRKRRRTKKLKRCEEFVKKRDHNKISGRRIRIRIRGKRRRMLFA